MLKGEDFQTFVGFIVNFLARLLEAQLHVFHVELRLGFFQSCDDLPLHCACVLKLFHREPCCQKWG